MKFAVYCITKNEEQFIDRMINSVIDETDELVIVDTGSTDGTLAKLHQWSKNNSKIKIHSMYISPWRFDIARNTSLSLVSKDIDVCLCLDLDEVMVKGWRSEIEKVWIEDVTTRGTYNYVWSWNGDKPAVSFDADKIHTRNNYRWHHPVHEILKPYWINEVKVSTKAEMHHFPDHTKSRGQYLKLLELSVLEDPTCDRNAYYLGREYSFHGLHEKTIQQMESYRSLPKAIWSAERGSSWRIQAKAHIALGQTKEALNCFINASIECPEMRESWTDLAQFYHDLCMWKECHESASKALEIKEVTGFYITERSAYGSIAHDLKSVSAWNLNKKQEAIEEAKKALEIEPSNNRISNNIIMMKEIFEKC